MIKSTLHPCFFLIANVLGPFGVECRVKKQEQHNALHRATRRVV